ncbi:cytochrome P450 [uncultured Jannaschia sp.]|uniref:cytochrome P450 n=1 Tax=uncultured Jannaschia sp. TaxID=293347 RepID=UPI002605DC20|nr:cytochrome P450 [uncultured Jannaschia sp.]
MPGSSATPSPALPKADLSYLPHLPVTPFFGHTLDVVRDSYGLHRRSKEAFGPIYRFKLLGVWRVALHGPDALEFILTDRDCLFSSHHGWDALHRLFPGGLMLRDFDDHRRHRRIMQGAFRAGAMAHYHQRIAGEMDALVANMPLGRAFAFYPAIKELTLRIGAAVFMGLPLDDPRTGQLNRAFIAEVMAALSPIRRPVPFTPMARGVAGRLFLTRTFRDLIKERRSREGNDFFSQMCRATDEDGTHWTDEEIVDHFNFLLMAAHDTTASALAALVWALGAHSEWQDRLVAEVDALPDEQPDQAALDTMVMTDRAFREVLRLVPPVPFIPRRAMRDFTWGGVDFPKGSFVTAMAGATMLSSKLYTDPLRFDPDRFSPNRAEDRRHRFAWTPFGGGAHKCIGLHFSTMQVKLFTASLLRRVRIGLPEGPEVEWQRMPIPRPKGGLPVVLSPRL